MCKCAEGGIKRGVVGDRVRRRGASHQAAFDYLLSLPLAQRLPKRAIVMFGGTRTILTVACPKIGVHVNSVSRRMRRTGCSRQEAFDHYAGRMAAQMGG